ncbi:MAG: hypothetical protein LBN10_10960 [Propionibacteriaceae bacterium]|jgi:hypothetical protein|nr:hypothetical protein [Propionibacteriaceae bacterium]
MSTLTTSTHTDTEQERPDWVVASPFRAYVNHLTGNADVPWSIVAFHAGVSQSAMKTLLYGRNGHARKIHATHARAILDITVEELRRIRVGQIPSFGAGRRIRLLRRRGVSWTEISHAILQPEEITRAIAESRWPSCSLMTDILTQVACQVRYIDHLPSAEDDMPLPPD